MRIVQINTVEIEIDDKKIVKMRECVIMGRNQEILIRNKADAIKLSKRTSESSIQMRKERYQEALKDNDRLYLGSLYESLTMKDLLKLLYDKTKRYV